MNKFYIGVLTTIITAAGVGGYNYFNSEEPPPQKPKTVKESTSTKKIGYIDLERLKDKLPNLDNLADLKRREERLRLELKYAMKPVIITPPKVEDKPFDDSVWQKNAQTIVSSAAEIEKRKKQAAEDYKKATEEKYLKKRDEANNQFLNEVLNIKLKLQNADNMRLTKDQISDLKKRLEEIQIERNALQRKLIEEWMQEIKTASEEAVKDDMERLKIQAEQAKLQVQQDAARTQRDAVERNKKIMEQAMEESTARQEKRQMLMTELQDITGQRNELENKIFDSIGDLTAKLAVIYKVNLILAKRDSEDKDKFLPINLANDESSLILSDIMKTNSEGAVMFPTSMSIDLTDELIKELDSQAAFEKRD